MRFWNPEPSPPSRDRERMKATVAASAEYLRSRFDIALSNRAELPNILSI